VVDESVTMLGREEVFRRYLTALLHVRSPRYTIVC
jgi:hypothetical protein